MDASPPQLSGPQRAGDGRGDETPTGGGGSLLYGKASMAAQPLEDRQQRGPGGRKEAEGPPKVGPLPLQEILVSAGLPGQSRRREAARICGRDRFWREGPVTAWIANQGVKEERRWGLEPILSQKAARLRTRASVYPWQKPLLVKDYLESPQLKGNSS